MGRPRESEDYLPDLPGTHEDLLPRHKTCHPADPNLCKPGTYTPAPPPLTPILTPFKAVQCYGEYNIVYSDSHPDTPAPVDSLDFRLGGSQKRHAIHEVAREWNTAQLASGNATFRVSAVDAWQLTDQRMETTSDGRHWIDEMNGYYSYRRRGIGEAEGTSSYLILCMCG